MYDLRDGNGFRCLHQLDVDRLLRKLRETKDKEQELTGKEAGKYFADDYCLTHLFSIHRFTVRLGVQNRITVNGKYLFKIKIFHHNFGAASQRDHRKEGF